MAIAVYVAVYLGLLMFLVGCIRRIVQYARTPIHLRWELYPVPHEEPSRAAHGGSYFEDRDWWTKPRRFSLTGELRVMIPEMLFLKGLWEFNRRLWYSSFPFHFGLYLAITSAVLVAISATLGVFAPAVTSGGFGLFLTAVYRWAGLVGAILTVVGAAALLFRRTRNEELKNYTTAADIFNLLFFIVTFAVLLPQVVAGGAGTVLNSLHDITGWLGVGLLIAGALALLLRRLTDKRLRPYTTPGDIFNLLFFTFTFGILVAAYWTSGGAFPGALAFTRGLLTFDAHLRLPGLFVVGLASGALLAAYIPFTHMSHFIAKYFTYHAVRWDDRPNLRGGSLESTIAEYLTYRPTWKAAHVGADGKKSWAEIVTTNPTQDVRNEK